MSHDGRVTVREAQLYTRPEQEILLLGAAISPDTARWCAPWADGLITISRPVERLKPVVEAWHAGEGRDKPMALQVKLSYARSEEKAVEEGLHQWSSNALDHSVLGELRSPQQFAILGELVDRETLQKHVLVSADPDRHRRWLEDFVALGFSRLYLHNVGRNQEEFIEDFGRRVLPAFR